MLGKARDRLLPTNPKARGSNPLGRTTLTSTRDQQKGGPVTFAKCVCVVLLATLLVMEVRPARAEALEPVFISMIVSGVIVVIALVAILIIANMSEG